MTNSIPIYNAPVPEEYIIRGSDGCSEEVSLKDMGFNHPLFVNSKS